MPYNAIDLFCGCGGMTEGLFQAGYRVVAAVEIDQFAAMAYRANNDQRGVHLFQEDIRKVDINKIQDMLNGEPLHLLAGCPPCQGFSTIRKKNKKRPKKDSRNKLIWEFVRFVEALMPMTIMLENVPALAGYTEFKKAVSKLKRLGYDPHNEILDVANFGVPQRRKRLVMVASLLGSTSQAIGKRPLVTVRDTIGHMIPPENSDDPVHHMYPHHGPEVQHRIEITPHDGGSRSDLPDEYTLECHKKAGIGFHDVYGRLAWDKVSSTITGGCLNPSKGRFLHPEQNRCISAREAALLQTFPNGYIFPTNIPRTSIALMIGNALPPAFCRQQAEHISIHLDSVFMEDIFDLKKRSEIISKIKDNRISPELYTRKLLCEMGYRHYRLKSPTLPCNPDIVYPGMKKAIFINGCFWHGHNCIRGGLPETNHDFWERKITHIKECDESNYVILKRLGWDYLVIWQCEIKESREKELREKLIKFLA
jgi:DNA (cytosine-5)-methyltransferase 1